MTPADLFRQRLDAASTRRADLARRAGVVSNLRLVIFAAGIGVLVWAEVQPERSALALGLFSAGLIVFAVLVGIHARLTERAERAAELAKVNAEALARLERDWDGLPRVPEPEPRGHGYAHDLDIFGHGSLTRYLGTTGTSVGRRLLHDWLLAPARPAEVRARQDAVRELVPELDFRQALQVSGRLAGDPDPAALEAFLEWSESEPWLLRRPLLLWAARAIPAATLVLAVLQLEGTLLRPWWLITLVVGAVLAGVYGKRMHRVLAGASPGEASLRHYAGLVGQIQGREAESAHLSDIRDRLTADCDARRQLERLGWLTELADLRHGGVFYVVINLPTLWDFHVLWALERWKLRAGRHVREWVDAVARMDALAALAGPLHDEDGWSFPELGGDRFAAEGLAHPLLAPDARVANDVEVGPQGTFLMVTGSNMSGKSTLLRAIGVNAVLAQAGGPVCAASLRLPPTELRTSMRVEDSLERGISLFMAELQQLKRVVDAADLLGTAGPGPGDPARPDEPAGHGAADGSSQAGGKDGPVLLYILDEVLHGTNSAERQVAIREVLSHLLARRAIGAISTHDLSLADAEPLASAVVPVHFQETVHPEGHEPPMTFDYRLRDGIATSTNALKLVRLVGLA